jgi:hypothetical protein
VEIGLIKFQQNHASAIVTMSEKEQPTQPAESNQPTKGSRSALQTGGTICLVLVAILALGFAGYTAMNPHTTTITQQQLVTNTQAVYNTETQTVTSIQQVNQVATVTQTINTAYGYGNGNGNNQVCSLYGCVTYPGYNYNPPPYGSGYYYNGYWYGHNSYGNFVSPCQPSGSNNTVTCQGFMYQAPNGCTELVIPIQNAYIAESTSYQFYTLHNLPSNVPAAGTWITVSGQMYNAANTASNGAACPGNYINVSSIQ